MEVSLESVRERLAEELPAELMAHSERVREYALMLAEKFGYGDTHCVEIAALLHDNCKHYREEELMLLARRVEYKPDEHEIAAPQILHAPLGARRMWLDFGIVDREAMLAVAGHTTGIRGLGLLGRIIYCADKLEPVRDYDRADELRALAERNPEELCLAVAAANLSYLVGHQRLVHPASLGFYNELVAERGNG